MEFSYEIPSISIKIIFVTFAISILLNIIGIVVSIIK